MTENDTRVAMVAPEPCDVHTWFSLSYASYLVVNRSLLQSMPMEWQHRFTALLDELGEQFRDIKEPDYAVQVRDGKGRFKRDPIPHYNRGRTFVQGRTNVHPWADQVADYQRRNGLQWDAPAPAKVEQ